MTHDDLVAALERERVSYPDQLEAERYAPEPVERGPWTPAPVGPLEAAGNLTTLADVLHEADPRTGRHW